MFSLDIHSWKKIISQSLPGEAAQCIMAPSTRDEDMSSHDRRLARNSSVLILLYEKDGVTSFPLIKRPVYPGIHSGQICLPGGKEEPSDYSLVDTALRETKEELGVDISSVEVIGSLSPIYIPVSNFNVQPVIGWWHNPTVFHPNNREVDGVHEMSLKNLIGQKGDCSFTINVNNREVIAPYFKINNDVIWGATAMILSELKELMKLSGVE